MNYRQQLDAAKRELALRRSAYPGWVRAGKLSPQKAQHEIEAMQAICETLQRVIDLDEAGLAWIAEERRQQETKREEGR